MLSCYLNNCLFDRMSGGQVAGLPGNEFQLRNCTWHGGRFDLDRWYSVPAIPVSIRDCAFDGTTFYLDSYGNTDFDYNAFLDTAPPPRPDGPNDTSVSSFNWQSGLLGDYYLPYDSALFDRGSQGADDAGLSERTTLVNQNVGVGTVDIGFHYKVLPRAQSLVAMCRPWWITVEWHIPVPVRPYVTDILVKRAVGTEPYSIIQTIKPRSYIPPWNYWRRYVDINVLPGTVYT